MCNNPNWTPKANCAKGLAIAVMVFAVLSCLGFVVGGWTVGIGGVLGIVASSLVLCCGPTEAGPGKGCMFKAAGIISLIAAICEVVGLVLLILVITAVAEATSDSNCVENMCAKESWETSSCVKDAFTACTSESACRTFYSDGSSLCGTISAAATGFVAILLTPAMVLAGVTFALELAYAINALQAASSMERSAKVATSATSTCGAASSSSSSSSGP